MKYIFWILTMVASIGFYSCSDNATETPKNTIKTYIIGLMDSMTFDASEYNGFTYSYETDVLSIGGTMLRTDSNRYYIQIKIKNPKVGTFQFDGNDNYAKIRISNYDSIGATYSFWKTDSLSGSITIDKYTPKEIEGTFQFDAYPDECLGDTTYAPKHVKKFRNGRFLLIPPNGNLGGF